MRLIDADALIEKYGDWYTEEGTEVGYIGAMKGIINSAPTIEPKQADDLISRADAIEVMACEMDGYTYRDKDEFNELHFKEALERGICANCKHLKRVNNGLAEFICDRKGAVVNDTRIRECDDMWESRMTDTHDRSALCIPKERRRNDNRTWAI